MPERRATFLLAPLLAAVFASCGGEGSAARQANGAATTAAQQLPPLAAAPLKAGEVLFSGEASPVSHGPFALDGRYRVRFEQFAPEDPKLDFAGQTPFTALLRRAGSRSAGRKLFGAASPGVSRELTAKGKYVLEVAFGDFPYAVRFTPRR